MCTFIQDKARITYGWGLLAIFGRLTVPFSGEYRVLPHYHYPLATPVVSKDDGRPMLIQIVALP